MRKTIIYILVMVLILTRPTFAGETFFVDDGSVIHTDDYKPLNEYVSEVRTALVNKLPEFTVFYTTQVYPTDETVKADIEDLRKLAYRPTGSPREGDYLLSELKTIRFSTRAAEYKGIYYIALSFFPEYKTTPMDETAITIFVNKWLRENQITFLSDREKVKRIYTWLRDNVKYDYSLDRMSVLDACNGCAVCNGYALLMQRLCLESGVNCRIITGEIDNEVHAWCAVQIGDKWYYSDPTWAKAGSYYLFLKGKDKRTEDPGETRDFSEVQVPHQKIK